MESDNFTSRLYDYNSTTPTAYIYRTTLNSDEERIAKFYESYDPMVGVRIAATLGSFFGLIILYIMYKSKCRKPNPVEGKNGGSPSPSEKVVIKFKNSIRDSIDKGIHKLRSKDVASSTVSIEERKDSISSYTAICQEKVRSLPTSLLRMSFSDSPRGSISSEQQIKLQRQLSIPNPPTYEASSNEWSLHVDGNLSRQNSISSKASIAVVKTPLSRQGSTGSGSQYGMHLNIPFVCDRPVLKLPSPGESWTKLNQVESWSPDSQGINIKVIQPTPNISPCGSIKTLSDERDPSLDGGSNDGRLLLPHGCSSSKPSHKSDGSASCEVDCESAGSDSVFDNESFDDTSEEGLREKVSSHHTSRASSPSSTHSAQPGSSSENSSNCDKRHRDEGRTPPQDLLVPPERNPQAKRKTILYSFNSLIVPGTSSSTSTIPVSPDYPPMPDPLKPHPNQTLVLETYTESPKSRGSYQHLPVDKCATPSDKHAKSLNALNSADAPLNPPPLKHSKSRGKLMRQKGVTSDDQPPSDSTEHLVKRQETSC